MTGDGDGDTLFALMKLPRKRVSGCRVTEEEALMFVRRQILWSTGFLSLGQIGAQRSSGLGLITQLHILEEELSSVPAANAFLRPGWFMENFQWDISSARQKGEFPSFLYPLERQIPMVATHDIGRLAAQTLQQEWQGLRRLEVEGPHRYSPIDAASVFSRLFQRPVSAVSIPRQQWASVFQEQGTPLDRTAPRIEMLDGFNSGWIEFEQQNAEPFKGIRTLEDTLTAMARKP
jgi:NAD(P)H dehydrogenase (quinone)